MLWWESDTGALWFWYVDANSSQWVQINFTPTGVATAETRNRLVNGAMQISQENGDTAVGNAAYPADQWIGLYGAGGLTSIFGRGADSTLTTNKRRIVALVQTPKATLAANDYVAMTQRIEGTRVADFQWGSASAKPVVLAFKASANSGTYAISLRGGTGRSYVVNFVIPTTNLWAQYSIAIPGDTGGTWVTDTGVALEVGFAHSIGSSSLTAPGTWTAGNFLGATGMTNNAAVANGFSIGDVGLYLDPLATGVPPRWQMPDEAQELEACKRYWQWFPSIVVETNIVTQSTIFPVAMRAVPAFTSSTGAAFTATSVTYWTALFYNTTRTFADVVANARM
jgi:hypothetical protein